MWKRLLGVVCLVGAGLAEAHSHMRGPVDSSSLWAKCEAQARSNRALMPTNAPTAKQKAVLVPLMATREHRVSHALWHTTRAELTEAEKTSILNAYGAGWTNPHPECPFTPENPYGSDFLFMHRLMVNDWQNALMNHKNEQGEPDPLPCVAAWTQLPPANSRPWPVPGKKVGVKTDSAYGILHDWETAFFDPQWLKQRSLSEVGFVLEVTLHNNMHMRWTEDAPLPRFGNGAELPLDGGFSDNWVFDDVEYDWLADPYGAHLNPHFWKLHGLVDLVVDAWTKAHGYDRVGTPEECAAAVASNPQAKCHVWPGRWTGGVNENGMKGPLLAARALVGEERKKAQRAESTLREKRLKMQARGVLDEATLKQEREPIVKMPVPGAKVWANDPYDYVKKRFCVEESGEGK